MGPLRPAEAGNLYFLWRSQFLTLQNQKLQLMFFSFFNYAHSLLEGQHRTEVLWYWETETNESSLEDTETSRQRKGKSHVAVKFFSKGTVNRNIRRYLIRQCTDRSCSRSPSCRPCQGQSPACWCLLSEPPLWTASYNPNLIDLLEDREKDTKEVRWEGYSHHWVYDSKPQKHRNMQRDAWKIYCTQIN